MEKSELKNNGSPSPMPASDGNGVTAKLKSVSQEINLRQPVFDGLCSSCRRCGRTLTAKRSRMHGYGSTCYKRAIKGNLKRAKALMQAEPRTITDSTWAERTIRAVAALVLRIPLEDAGFNGCCTVCGTTIHQMPVESFDHPDGMALPGFGRPQWVYLHDDHNDLAIWKLRISADNIRAELDRMYPGQVPQVVPPAAAPKEARAA